MPSPTDLMALARTASQWWRLCRRDLVESKNRG